MEGKLLFGLKHGLLWSSLGCLHEVLSGRGHIDIGIRANATVEVCRNHRRRGHIISILNRVEVEIEKYKANWVQEEDVSLWRNEKCKYKKCFPLVKHGTALERNINSALGILLCGSSMQLQNTRLLLGW